MACTGLSWSWANRTAQTTTGGSCGNSSLAFDQNNRIAGSGYEYDAAGNVTVNPAVGMSHQWDAEGRMKSMGGTSAVYTYDADGRRVVKTVGGTSTYYYYDIAGKVSIEKNQSNVWAVGYIYLNGKMVATYKDSTTYFAHRDHLGSTRVLTKLDKSVQDNMDYLPYGEQVSGGSSTSHKFTGHERDAESGLDYMGARYYGSLLGRFMSSDRIGNDNEPVDPQRWNLYMYSRNNPITYVDDFGEEIRYATPDLQTRLDAMRSASETLDSALKGFEGAGAPDLEIGFGDAGFDADGVTKANGIAVHQFGGDISDFGLDGLKYIPLFLKRTLVTIDDQIREDAGKVDDTLLHEIGHADDARREPTRSRARSEKTKMEKGKTPHEQRPEERTANDFKKKVKDEMKKTEEKRKQEEKERKRKQKEEEKRKKKEKKAD